MLRLTESIDMIEKAVLFLLTVLCAVAKAGHTESGLARSASLDARRTENIPEDSSKKRPHERKEERRNLQMERRESDAMSKKYCVGCR